MSKDEAMDDMHEHAATPVFYEIPGTGLFPEGLAYDGTSGSVFTTSMLTGAVFRMRKGQGRFEAMTAPGACASSTGIGIAPDSGRLLVCGGVTGCAYILDVESGHVLCQASNGLVVRQPKNLAPNADAPTFINDVAVAGGDAYFTDSYDPTIWRVSHSELEVDRAWRSITLEPWISLRSSVIRYQDDGTVPGRFNLNGIVATPDGKSLITVQTNTGKLYRVDVGTRDIIEISGEGNPGGDGLLFLANGDLLSIDMTKSPTLTRLTLLDDNSRYWVVAAGDAPGNLSPTSGVFVDGQLLLTESQIADTLIGGKQEHLPWRVTAHSLHDLFG